MIQNPRHKDNLIVNMTFEFALEIIDYADLLETKRKYKMADQIFRSGTSIGANVHEAQNAESKADFIHKFKIAMKECEETNYWLNLCLKSKHFPDPIGLLEKQESISKVLNKIIGTSKKFYSIKK